MKRIILVSLLMCTTGLPAFAQSFPMRNGLPATNMDSFVYEAAGDADHIYGDEGKWDIPPFDSFTVPHRINTGIHGDRAAGITTGHGSYLPDGVGGDEWTGNEWSMSGAGSNGGNQGGQTVMSPAIQAGGQSGALPQTSITGRPWKVGGSNPPPQSGVGGQGDPNQYMSPGSTVTAPPDNGGGNAPPGSPGATAPQPGSGTREGGGG